MWARVHVEWVLKFLHLLSQMAIQKVTLCFSCTKNVKTIAHWIPGQCQHSFQLFASFLSMQDKHPTPLKGQRLAGCRVVGQGSRKISSRHQDMHIVWHPELATMTFTQQKDASRSTKKAPRNSCLATKTRAQ